MVLVGVAAAATTALVLAAALDKQRYLLLLPLATSLAKAVVVTATPLLRLIDRVVAVGVSAGGAVRIV